MSARAPDRSAAVRRRILFSGRVQGVGFRFTTERIAAGFAVTGYVRNLSDGRVELLAEGEESTVEKFQQAIELSMSDHISGADVATSTATDEFTSFRIAQ